jgi:putative transposase
MPRRPRPLADGLLYQALNRGNNRAAVFGDADDYRLFLTALAKTQQRYPFRLYGYCLMTNHFHLLLAPEPGQSVSRILQSLTVAHTWHYHRAGSTSGHVWQGRFRSPVVQEDEHARVVLRYLEANPLRAGLVSDLASYPWSSYPVHGLGRVDPLVSPLPGWQALGRDEAARQAYWRTWVPAPVTQGGIGGGARCGGDRTAVRGGVVVGASGGGAGIPGAPATGPTQEGRNMR